MGSGCAFDEYRTQEGLIYKENSDWLFMFLIGGYLSSQDYSIFFQENIS